MKVRAADNDAIRRRGGEENARDPSGLPRRTENARFVRRFTSSYEILLPRNTRVSLKADKKAPKTDCLTTNMARSTSVAS